MTAKERREKAQEVLLDGVATALGYWAEQHPLLAQSMSPEEQAAFRAELHKQADRVAKLFGFEEAWSN